MSQQDQIKWNKKYKETPKLLELREPAFKLQQLIQSTCIQKALDVACGSGKNAIYMAKHNIEVDAMDISQVALQSLSQQGFKQIHTHLVDFDEYVPKKEQYDLIVKTNFLDRNLIPKLIESLKSGGYFYIETYMHDEINEKVPSNKDFLLQKEELKRFFTENFKVLDYSEFENEPDELYKMKKQSILVQKN